MATSPVDESIMRGKAPTVVSLINGIEHALDQASDGLCGETAARLRELLPALHASLRQRYAASATAGCGADGSCCTPELSGQVARLVDEHATILGMIDRILQCMDLAETGHPDEQIVCALRIREVIAVIRRHEAEEDCVLYRSVWLDQGGEG